MNTPKKPKVQKPFDRDYQLSLFPDGWDAIPLNPYNATRKMPNGKIVPIGKAPRDARWTTVRYNAAEVIRKAIASGANIGWRLPSTICAVDVDPRNGGDDGIAALCFDLGIDLDLYPTAITGSGGRHVFMTIPKGTLIRDTLEDEAYKGVEFKSKGRQVVAAGSLHPNGKPYVWDESKPSAKDGIPPIPKQLLTLITRPERNAITGGGQYTSDQVAQMLATMNPESFRDHDKWLQLMQACHHASNGDARYEFVAWSTSDERYSKDADMIGRRWDTMHADRNDGVTYRSLIRQVHKHGTASSIPAQRGAGDDFDDSEDLKADKIDAWFESDGLAEGEDLSNWDTPYVMKPMKFEMINLDGMLDHAEIAMALADVPLYQMRSRLVHPVRREMPSSDDDTIRRAAGALTIDDVGSLRLTQYMIRHAPFFKVVTPKGAKPVSSKHAPSELIAKHFIARTDKWSMPHLTGIIETPTLRRDGTLLVEEGYDLQSGLLLDMGGVAFPAIPEAPTRAQALNGLALLKFPLKDFPFVPDGPNGLSASRSVMLSAILTALVRRSLPSAPMHGFSAPTAGTGKTVAVQVAAMIATGREVTAMSQGANEEENEKRIFSVFMQGDQVVAIDNVTRPIGGNALCTILTEEFWQSRILGLSRNVSVATNVLMTATGNNLVFEGDMTRRALMSRMDAGVENPEGRSFDLDLKEWVPKNRIQLVVAGLTVLRAFVSAGRPGLDKLSPFGSFEHWSNLVRGALVWLGEADPCLTRESIKADDPVKGEFGDFLRAVHRVVGSKEFSAGDLMTIDETDDDPGGVSLLDVIQMVAPHADRAKLGRYLKSHDNQIINGLRLQGRFDNHRKANLYRVVKQ